MVNILGIGECMVELNQRSDGLLCKKYAGDVLNTLWYARAKMSEDAKIGFHSAFGADPLSQEMLNFIQGAEISCEKSTEVSDRSAGLYMIHLDGAERSFSYWRSQSAARLLMEDPAALWARVAEADVVYLSGITLAIIEGDGAEMLLKELRSHLKEGAKIAFDPNIRPALWADKDRMKKVIEGAAAISDIVLPSSDDEAACFGDESPEVTAQRYAGLGAETVVVKNGETATLSLTGGVLSVHPVSPAEGVVDTTAAGDSFNGAFLASYFEKGDLGDAVIAAQNCAAQVVCKHGALIPFDDLV